MILDIRGTHGSGKSHIVHTLLSKYGHEDIKEKGVLIGHYIDNLDCAVVGPYTKVCGGCDAVKTADEIVRRIRLFHSSYTNVILEGVLVSHTYKRYADLATELGCYHFLFLTTPLATCIARVRKRRMDRGNQKPLDPKNVIRDHSTTHRKLPSKFRASGHNVQFLDWRNPVEQIVSTITTNSSIDHRMD